jgi:hypothetical protein
MHQQQGKDEVRDRVRRIETRITKVAEHFGIDVGGGKPAWDDSRGAVTIPTPNCSIGDILKAVPEGRRHTEIKVYVHGSYLFTLFVDR